MPPSADNPSGPAWKEFLPLQQNAQDKQQEPSARRPGCCQFCKSRRFIRSGLRGSDVFSIFLLRYPVRCLRCRQRQLTDFLTASLALAAGSPVYSAQKKRENWGAWTSGSDREAAEALILQLRERQKNDPHSSSE